MGVKFRIGDLNPDPWSQRLTNTYLCEMTIKLRVRGC